MKADEAGYPTDTLFLQITPIALKAKNHLGIADLMEPVGNAGSFEKIFGSLSAACPKTGEDKAGQKDTKMTS